MTLTWGAVCRAKQGQSISGDSFFVQEYSEGRMLAAVIDGLGGGEEAARAAEAAKHLIAQNLDWPLQELVKRSHVALHSTRGAVMALLRLEQETRKVSYVGVGNIGVQVYSRQPIRPISKNGIIGYRIPTLLELTYTYEPGDIFVLYSDGISSHFTSDTTITIKQPPQRLAEQILEIYGKQIDDATVVVIQTMAPA